MFYKKGLICAAILCSATATQAQTAGSTIVSAGWLHLAPQSSSKPLEVTSPVNVTKTGTGSSVSSADTLGLLVNHFFTDKIAGEFVLGVPPTHKLNGTGSYEKYGELGSVKQWSPAVLVKYFFGDATTRFRPYVGVGVNYTWYSDAKVTNSQFAAEQLLNGNTANTSVKADASWNPVFTVGANYALTDRWYAGAFVSYLPLKTTAKITTTGTPLGTVTSEASIKIRPIVTSLNIGYRF